MKSFKTYLPFALVMIIFMAIGWNFEKYFPSKDIGSEPTYIR